MREKNRESKNVNPDTAQKGPEIMMIDIDNDRFKEYMAVCLFDQFPIELQRSELMNLKTNESEEKKQGYDPNAINLKLIELVRFVHGSLEAR